MSIVSIVIPVFNNAISLPDLLFRFQNLAAINKDDFFEFIFIDDGSIDNSYSVLVSLFQKESRIQIVKLSRNFGSNAALLAGLGQASGDVIAAIAADLQDPPELVTEMLAEWRQGNMVILAARQSRKDDFLTTMLSDTFYMLFRKLAIHTMPKRGFDFFLIDRKVCDLLNGIQENNAYLMGLILWLGFTPKVIYYQRQAREKRFGHSMWTFAKKVKYFLDSFVAFSYFPVRAASILGITLSVIGMIYALIVIIIRLATSVDPQGWASLMIVVLIVSGVQMIMIGILGEYLWRNLDETRRRPRFIIESIVKK
jgi:polyisoprenyl-phosphate glycosyltransferase